MNLKKLNRGCILLLALVIGIVIYLIVFNAGQNATRRQLIDLYGRYLEAEKPFLLLDETDDAVWTKNCTDALSPFLSQNTEAVKNVQKDLSENRKYLRSAENGSSFTSFEKVISDRPPTVTTEGDYACLAIAIEINYVQNDYTSKEVTTKYVLFCKENGEWKITVPDGTSPATLYGSGSFYNDFYYYGTSYATDALIKEVGYDA